MHPASLSQEQERSVCGGREGGRYPVESLKDTACPQVLIVDEHVIFGHVCYAMLCSGNGHTSSPNLPLVCFQEPVKLQASSRWLGDLKT